MFDEYALKPEVFNNPLISWQMVAMRILGLFISKSDSFKWFHFFRGIILSFSMILLFIAQAKMSWLFRNDLQRFSLPFGSMMVYLNISVRITCFYWYHKEYVELLILLERGVNHVLKTSLPTELEIYKRYIRYITRMGYITLISLTSAFIVLCCEGASFLVFSYKNWTIHKDEVNITAYLAPIFDLYPTRVLGDNFIIAFIGPFYMSSLGLISLFAWHTFNASLMRYASFRLDVVNFKIENISKYVELELREKKLAGNSITVNCFNSVQKSTFASCVEDVVAIKSFVDRYEKISSAVILVQSATDSSLLCVILYLTSTDLTAGSGVYFAWGVITAGILWIYYWHANEISEKSYNITNSLYSCCWYEFPLSLQKELALFMKGSMRPMAMKALFINMNTNALVTILKTSYSYFTLLQNVAK